MDNSKRIGRGVAAIISSSPSAGNYLEIPLAQIIPNQRQPRKEFDSAAFESLVQSIEAVGLLQPVLVREVQRDQYELIAGERRFRAVQKIGLPTIPAIVKSSRDQDSLEQALAENLHRAELNPLEEAAAYKSLIDDFGLSQEEVASRVQKSRAVISNTIRLTQLPPEIHKLIIEGSLTAGHARALLALKTEKQQIAVSKKVVKENWSVRRLEEFAQKEKPAKMNAKTSEAAPTRSAVVVELENLLGEHLSTRVKVQIGSNDRGKISVEFFGVDDLERIYKKMHGS